MGVESDRLNPITCYISTPQTEKNAWLKRKCEKEIFELCLTYCDCPGSIYLHGAFFVRRISYVTSCLLWPGRRSSARVEQVHCEIKTGVISIKSGASSFWLNQLFELGTWQNWSVINFRPFYTFDQQLVKEEFIGPVWFDMSGTHLLVSWAQRGGRN